MLKRLRKGRVDCDFRLSRKRICICCLVCITAFSREHKGRSQKGAYGSNRKDPEYSSANTEKSGEQASEYWTILGRTLKITDTLLAMFTFLVIPVGIGQAYFLKRTVVHMRISERAHVSGGANIVSLDGGKVLVVTINNYGKNASIHWNHGGNYLQKRGTE